MSLRDGADDGRADRSSAIALLPAPAAAGVALRAAQGLAPTTSVADEYPMVECGRAELDRAPAVLGTGLLNALSYSRAITLSFDSSVSITC